MKKPLIVAAIVIFGIGQGFGQGVKLRPGDWAGDFIEKISIYGGDFEMDLRFEKSYHEMESAVWINTTMVSTYPVTVEQYAFFLKSTMDSNPDKAIPESWIPSSIALTESGRVTYDSDDAKSNAELKDIEGAREFCVWLTDWLNNTRKSSELPELPKFRVTTVGEAVTAMNSFVKIRDTDYDATDDPINVNNYVRLRNEEIRSYTVYYVNNETFESSSDKSKLDAGILNGESKLKLGGLPTAGFYVSMSIDGAYRGY